LIIVSFKFCSKDSPLLPSGLFGPVTRGSIYVNKR